MAGLGGDGLQALALGRRQGLAQQALGLAGDQGDRGAQLMGHAIGEGALPLPGGGEALLQLVEGGGDRLQLAGLLGFRQQGQGLGGPTDLLELAAEGLDRDHQAALEHLAQQGGGEQAGQAGRRQQQQQQLALPLDRGGHVLTHQQAGGRPAGPPQAAAAGEPGAAVPVAAEAGRLGGLGRLQPHLHPQALQGGELAGGWGDRAAEILLDGPHQLLMGLAAVDQAEQAAGGEQQAIAGQHGHQGTALEPVPQHWGPDPGHRAGGLRGS